MRQRRCSLSPCSPSCSPGYGATPADEGARNLALLRQYGELGRKGDYAAQAAMWAPDAVNNGRPMSSRRDPLPARGHSSRVSRSCLDRRSRPPLPATSSSCSRAPRAPIAAWRRPTIYGGMLRGAQPLGKHFEVLRAHWWRFKDGKIVWHQVVSDDLGMMRQLGLIPDYLAGRRSSSGPPGTES